MVQALKQSKSYQTRQKILKAAASEFADKGYDGVRMEHVALKAGCNKALVYRYYTDRDTLYRAAMREKLIYRDDQLRESDLDLPALMQFWFLRAREDKEFMKLLLQESLGAHQGEPVEKEARHRYYQKQVSVIEELQKEGKAPKSVDAKSLYLMLLGMVMMPIAFPAIAEMTMDRDVSDIEAIWSDQLAAFSKSLV